MFRRKEDGTEELITDSNSNESSAFAGATIPSAPLAAAAAPSASSFRPAPPQAAMVAASRPVSAPSSMSESPRAATTPVNRPNAKRVLTVGPDIQMKGEITSCDRVVIEGMVDATMRDVHTVELTETGSLKGTAEVEDAEISGSFEGDLVVRGKLTVYSSGRVRGNVTYGEIEIQRGGQISGNVRNVADVKNSQSMNKVKVA
jgi:cytoskeletal protein CcmA (bactofilin family)